ncbi:unnamed protein product [Polarella glacialis]|uniref:carbonic anhydrase n=1 Tax=Polarella glacialis TaxID=89957 RepID=A0A813EMQ1_POLGL|nr:unnamed protein product [Polarella glacialis]
MAYYQNAGLPTAASMVVTPAMSDVSQEDPGEGFGPSKLGVRTTVDEPLSASQAIEVLQAGNRRFVQGDVKAGGLGPDMRRALASHGQRPVATVIGCADSRCPVEQLFDARPGDIFVLRNAGNTCTHAEGSMVGSVEYSVLNLETKMILVLGHTGCGAIMGATKQFMERSAQESTDQSTEASESEQPPQPGSCKSRSTLLGLLDALVPVAEQACVELGGGSTEEIAAHAVKVNVWRTINFLLSSSLIIREKVASGEVELQGAICDMSSGAVEFLGQSPKQAQLLNSDAHVAAQAASVFHFFECCAVQRVVQSQDGVGQDIKWLQMKEASSPSASAFPFFPAMAYYQNTGLPTAASKVVTPAMTDVSQEDPSEGFGPSKLGVRTTVDEPLSASQAIEVLQAGNRRFVQGDVKAGGLGPDMRRALASHGQRPVATVIGCADSRCPVEQLFDARPGDLFVLRNAGNTCTHAEGSMVGSVEYSVAILETKMILVLGHTGCGAIMGATKLFLERSTQKYIEMTCRSTDQSTEASESEQPPQPGCCKKKSTLLGLLDALVPVAEQACVELEGGSTEEIAAHAVKVNVWRTINFLLSYSLIIREKVASGEVELQGAVYNMSSGAVEFLGKSPKQEKLLNHDGHVVPSMGGIARQMPGWYWSGHQVAADEKEASSPSASAFPFFPAMAYYQNTGLPKAASMVVMPAMSDVSQEDPSEGFGPSKLGVRTTVDEPLSASQAIEVLQAGNRRFVQGDVKAGGLGPDMRRALASHGQRFWSTQKYIEMTCRKDAQESTDQSTEASEFEQPPQPGCCKKKCTLLGLLDALVPVAEQACVELEGGSTEEIAAHAVKVNVWRTINFLLSYSLIIREKVASGEVELQGAVYNMSSGAVEFLGKSPKQEKLLNHDGHVVPSMGGLARQKEDIWEGFTR